MKNPSQTQMIHRQIITRIIHAGISTYIGSRGKVGMRQSWVHAVCFVIITVLLVTSAGSVTGAEYALQLTPAEARKMITDSYRKWGKARIEFDKKTFERMLSPDFYVQLKNRSLTRQEFIDRISVQPQGAKLVRFDTTVLTLGQTDDEWIAVIQEKIELETAGGKAYLLWITRDGWKRIDNRWIVTFSEEIGNEQWNPGTRPPFADW